MGDSHWHNISVPLFGPRRQPRNGLNYLKLFQSQESYENISEKDFNWLAFSIIKNISLGQHFLIAAIFENPWFDKIKPNFCKPGLISIHYN